MRFVRRARLSLGLPFTHVYRALATLAATPWPCALCGAAAWACACRAPLQRRQLRGAWGRRAQAKGAASFAYALCAHLGSRRGSAHLQAGAPTFAAVGRAERCQRCNAPRHRTKRRSRPARRPVRFAAFRRLLPLRHVGVATCLAAADLPAAAGAVAALQRSISWVSASAGGADTAAGGASASRPTWVWQRFWFDRLRCELSL